jgi:hypothetical protein
MWRRLSLVVLVSAIPVLLMGQSLSDVAKKEKKRRENNREKGVKVRVVEEGEVSTEKTDTDPSDEPTKDAEVAGSAIDPFTDEKKPPKESSRSERQQQEAEWRARLGELKSRLNAAKERYEFLSGLHLTPGEYYVDENGRPLITSLEQLRQMVSQAKTDLDAAQKAMDDLKEEARKAGVPPGWLR